MPRRFSSAGWPFCSSLRARCCAARCASPPAAAPWIGLLTFGAGAALTFGTSLGERIVQLAKLDASAQTRLDVFKLFDYLSTNDLLYGVDFAEINFLLKTYKDVNIIEIAGSAFC